MENETCPVNGTCDEGEFTPGQLNCPYYRSCFDNKLRQDYWEKYWNNYWNSPEGKAEFLKQQEALDLDDIPF